VCRKSPARLGATGRVTLPVLGVLAVGACVERPELTVPTADEVGAYYATESALEAEVRGNLAVVTVEQSTTQLRRGGVLWAKVGPYIYLFTDETRQLLEDYPGLAAVRIVTRTAGGTEVARATLGRAELSGVLWRRSLNISGQARRDGTERLTLLEDLIRWGEEHTHYEYNSTYTAR
jgi:hypothetical protein